MFTADRLKLENFEVLVRRLVLPASPAQRAGRCKMLVFAEDQGSVACIRTFLTRLGVEHGILRGSAARIDNMVHTYSHADLDVLLLDGQHSGSGLNLQCTTDVVFLQATAPDTEGQVIGRAQRGERSVPLRVWRLLYTDGT